MSRAPASWVLERAEVDFIMVADRAEGINGKLYMMGGGWDRLSLIDFAHEVEVSLAIGLLIPWNDTNEQHSFTLVLESDDGGNIATIGPVAFQSGRPANAIPGQSFRSILAIQAPFRFAKPGAYRFAVALDNGNSRHVVIYAQQANILQPKPPGI